ncbi:butyrate kinase [Dysgonomonas sp. PH5-45]|uniref:butyrate kinase n=1 Tax=unclassified Dysgonomonas TaxID=2630389 RepID=UPI002474D0C6|nr:MULTISPECIES: butyrate kinase [unclassified Dysgonomonas]MDH6355338.1 butyrate kinase [Dysgonomonas sp. PH5-45]MDH6388236.1 butyrate kinase [Dysgonomonas sp. PH5-37]
MKILAINPGSTSTKIAVFDNMKVVFKATLRHSGEELAPFNTVIDQYSFRKDLIINQLKEGNVPFEFDAIIGRGGLFKPIPGGVYEVNDAMIRDIKNTERHHASNLGCLIASEMAKMLPNCRAFIADPVVVDELNDIARISGSPLLPKVSIFHALNQKAIARRYASDINKKYEDLDLIVCHMGGGISTGVHAKGRVIDVNNALDGEGPFSPERSGTLPVQALADLCFSGKYTHDQVKKMIVGNGGLMAHLGLNDLIEIEKNIENGDKKAEEVMDAMSYNIAKSIGAASVVLKGKVDAIILTGGAAYSDFIVPRVTDAVSFIAPVKVYPGEDELEALASNAEGALNGSLSIKEYK